MYNHNIPNSIYDLDITNNAALVVHLALSPNDAGTVTFYVPVVLRDFCDDDDNEGDNEDQGEGR